MKASEMIGELTQLILEHGDHEVHFWAGALIEQSPAGSDWGDWDATTAGGWVREAHVKPELRNQPFIRVDLKLFVHTVEKT